MPVMDEFQKEREALKSSSFTKKLEYFWDYYRWYVLIAIIIIVVIVSLVRGFMNRKDSVFFGVFLNSYQLSEEDAFINTFADAMGVDLEEYEMTIDSSLYISTSSYDETTMTSAQKLMVYTAAKEIDVLISDATAFEQYANNETFYNLYDILSPDQITLYEPYFYYIDQKAVEEKNAAQDANIADYVPTYPNPRQPELMTEPIPVAIYMNDCSIITDAYSFREEDIPMGIVINTQHLDMALEFLDYAFNY